MAKMRIDKLLSNMGYGSRREIKSDLKMGKITVNGITAKDPSSMIDTESDKVMYLDDLVEYREFVYIMMNKPQGVISATEDSREETVIDLLPDSYKAFSPFPVGRLDKDTEGLLIITNNGKMAHNMLSPKKHVKKLYYAHVSGKGLTQKDVLDFSRGIFLNEDNYKCLPAELKILDSKENESTCEVIIEEGKYHQVKRMFEASGRTVTFIKRISMGPIELDSNIAPGDFRELNDREMELLENYL